MNIFSKNKDNGFGGDVKKSSSFSRLRQATNKSIRSFRSARAYNKDVDRSLKMLNSIDSETKSGEERNNEDSISELFEENQNSKSNKKESTENVNEKEHPHDKLLHSKQGSVISKNHSIKSKIKKISKISSLKKKGKNLYNELSKEFKITNHVDDIISSTQPNSNKLSSTDSFSDWFNSISSTPPIQSQASSSNVSTPMQSPLINEIVFSSPEPIVKNKNNRKWKGSSSPPKDNNSTEYLSTSSSSPSSLPPNDLSNTNNGEQLSVTINNNENLSKGIQENSDLKSNNKNLATIDPMNIPLVFSKDRLNSKIAPGREITVSKQLPPLPVGLRYIGEIQNKKQVNSSNNSVNNVPKINNTVTLNSLNIKDKKVLGSTGVLDNYLRSQGNYGSNKINPTNANKNIKHSLDSLHERKKMGEGIPHNNFNLDLNNYREAVSYEMFNNYASITNLQNDVNDDSAATLSAVSRSNINDYVDYPSSSLSSVNDNYLSDKSNIIKPLKSTSVTTKHNYITKTVDSNNNKIENYHKILNRIDINNTITTTATTKNNSIAEYGNKDNIMYTYSTIVSSSQTIASTSSININETKLSKINPIDQEGRNQDQMIFDKYYNIYQNSKNNISRNDSEESLSNYL